MNSLLYYYNNVQKMAAYRQAKRMQRGALTAQGGFSTTDPALRQTPFTIQCVIRPTKVTSTLQVAFNTKGDSTNPRVDLNRSGNIVIYGGGSMLYTKPANLDSIYDIVFVATDSQLSLFVDGTLITSVSYVNTISLYNIGFYFANNSLYFQGDYLLHRHFNYAMSADEVKALDNNGDPMGYVVPKAMRELLSVNLIGSNSFTWDGSDSPYYYNITGNPITIGKYYKINVTVSDYQSGSPRIFAGISYPIPAQNGTFDIVVYNERYVNNFPIYGGSDGDPNRHLTITVNSITSVGLLAEYLPQNLMEYPNAGDLDVLSTNSYTWTGPDDSNYGISIPLSGYITAKKCVVTIEVSNYEAGAPFFKISTSNSTSIPQQNGTFELEQIILGDAYNRVAIYGGNVGTDRRMTITVKGIRQINGISYSWLDSAKQLPLSDEYMEPLFQSISGYDMMANGAPEILYNE